MPWQERVATRHISLIVHTSLSKKKQFSFWWQGLRDARKLIEMGFFFIKKDEFIIDSGHHFVIEYISSYLLQLKG